MPALGMSADGPAKQPAPTLEPAPPTGPIASDPLLPKAWHLQAIGAFDAWKVSKGSAATLLAIVDSGVLYNHPDIAPNLRRKAAELPMNGRDKDGNGFVDDVIGWDFVSNKNLPFDESGHGTFLSGVAVGVENNGLGTVGVCPRCSLLPVRFIDGEGLGDTADAIKGIRYAVMEGASVINLSFAGEGFDKDLEKAIIAAGAKDILVVVSAGNDAVNLERDSVYPAKFQLPNMLTVASTNAKDKLTEGSNWSRRYVHLAAPGESIVGPWFNEWDDTGEGTSVAAAIVSAAAALVRSAAPDLSAEQTKDLLMATARPVASLKKKVASGVLDLGAAMACAKAPGRPCLQER